MSERKTSDCPVSVPGVLDTSTPQQQPPPAPQSSSLQAQQSKSQRLRESPLSMSPSSQIRSHFETQYLSAHDRALSNENKCC